MSETEKLLKVKNLKTSFYTKSGVVHAVDDISFELESGKVLGIVGESGSGKSVTAYSILQILASSAKIDGGSITFRSKELLNDPAAIRQVRGNKISIIFQDPMTSLNPVFTIENQLIEPILLFTDLSRKQASEKAQNMLEVVGINDPARRLKQYPHELSGGMRQRVMIAMALVCEPDILIADEPTTALDVTIQAQILELMKELQSRLGMATLLITHDLGVVAGMCDEVLVMYAGKIVEGGTVDDIFYNPKHEYTKGLLKSIPSIESKKSDRLIPISGTPVDLLSLPKGCAFAPRCEHCMKICLTKLPQESTFEGIHRASCWMNHIPNVEG
jgi:oligopeptide transport system ATP-binding protein